MDETTVTMYRSEITTLSKRDETLVERVLSQGEVLTTLDDTTVLTVEATTLVLDES